jgi:hypothetical protein
VSDRQSGGRPQHGSVSHPKNAGSVVSRKNMFFVFFSSNSQKLDSFFGDEMFGNFYLDNNASNLDEIFCI